jgi:hypothetical protein
MGGQPAVSASLWLFAALLRTGIKRTKLFTVIALLVGAGLLSGCVIEPGGCDYGITTE